MHHHRYSFFGQKVGLLLDSGDRSHPNLYFRFIKKKASGSWEKPSVKEGKVVKFNLLELVSVIKALDHPGSKWTTVHKFHGESTPITIEHKGKNAIILLPGYFKHLNLNEVELLLDLLKHIYNEKIEYATSGLENGIKNPLHKSSHPNFSSSKTNDPRNSNPKISQHSNNNSHSPYVEQVLIEPPKETESIQSPQSSQSSQFSPSPAISDKWIEQLPQEEDYYLVPGVIEARSQKAVAFQLNNHKSTWIPISCIREVVNTESQQGLWVKKGFVHKKAQDMLA